MDENTITKNWGTIPEFFYDLISRIPPGVFLFVVLLNEFNFFEGYSSSNIFQIEAGSAVLIFFILVVCGHVLGNLLSSFGRYIPQLFYTSSLLKKYIKKDKVLFKKFIEVTKIEDINLDKIDEFKDHEFYKIYRESHDFVKQRDERANIIIPKLGAEASLIPNFIYALIIAVIVHLINRLFYSSQDLYHWSFYLWVLAFIGILIKLGKNNYERLLRFLVSFLRNIINKNYT